MDLLAAEAGFFRHQGVRGQAVVTAGGFADRQINRFQLLGAEAAFMQHRIVRQRLLQRRRRVAADGEIGVRHFAHRFFDPGENIGGFAGGVLFTDIC